MEFNSYSHFWDHQAATPESALAAVDGSASEEIVQQTGAWTAAQMRAALQLDGSQRVLELGCGVGRIGRELLSHCQHWTGVDISASMIRVATERLSHSDRVDSHQLTRTDLAMIESDSLDAVYSVAVLCHMDKEDLYLYLQEIRRILKPQGRTYLETWNLAHPIGWKRWDFEVRAWQKSDQSQRKNVSRNQFCTPDEFLLYARHAGLDVIASWTDSPWIQVVLGKDLDQAQCQSHLEALEADQEIIAYSTRFGELFGELIDVLYGVTQPTQMWESLANSAPCREVTLYRDYLHTLWEKGPEHWGQPPAK